jgi:cell division protein FtsN
MSRIRDLVRRDDSSPAVPSGSEAVVDARGPLPWLEAAPDDFDDDAADEPLIPRKWLLLGGLLFLTLLAGVVYAVYQRSAGVEKLPQVALDKADVDDPRIPMIEAPKTPVRERPADAGGMQMADTDKQVFDVIDGQVTQEPTQLAQGAEMPVDRPAPPPGPAENPIPDVQPVEPPMGVLPDPAPVTKVEPKPPVAKPLAKPAEKKPVVAKPVEKPPVIKPEPPKPAPVPAPVMASSGGIYVQLGAFSSRDRAEAAWGGLSGKPGLSGVSSNIQAAAADKYRLRAGPFGSRAEAEAACSKLKAAGQACLIAK